MKKFLFGLLVTVIGLLFSGFIFVYAVMNPIIFNDTYGLMGSLLGAHLLFPFIISLIVLIIGVAICAHETYPKSEDDPITNFLNNIGKEMSPMDTDKTKYEEVSTLINIRNEKKDDNAIVEEITRKAFYNIYAPGCGEHYLVHIMRTHEDFIPELDFVLELDGKVIGNIMYTKAKLVDESGTEKEILTFGPVSIAKEYQRMGYGKMLIEYSFKQAVLLGYDLIVIFGSPINYVSRGFKSCKKYNVCVENGKYPAAMMVKELVPNALNGEKWVYHESPVMAITEEDSQQYDDTLEKMEKKHQASQEEFYIMSHSFIEEDE